MKHRKGFLIILIIMSLALVFTGCGSSSDDNNNASTTQVSTAEQSQQASSAAMQSTSMAMGANDIFSGLSNISSVTTGAPALPKLNRSNSFGGNKIFETAARVTGLFGKSPSVQAVAALRGTRAPGDPVSCQISGTRTTTGSLDLGAGTIDVTITFNECRENGQNMDGTLRMQGSFAETTSSITVTANVDIDEYEGDTIVTSLSLDNVVFTESATLGANQYSGTFMVNANGSITVTDHVDAETGTITYSSFGQTINANMESSEIGTASITTTGGISVSFSENGNTITLSVTYGNMVIGLTSTSTYDEFSINGSVTYDFTPNEFCFEGTYVIDTVTPVRESKTEGHTVAGEVTINDAVDILFNADGSVTVTFTGSSQNYTSIEDLEGLCPFQIL